MIKHFCDICGNQLPENISYHITVTEHQGRFITPHEEIEEACPPCARRIRNLIREMRAHD